VDRLGQLLEVRDALGNLTTAQYDSLGRRVSMTSPDTGRTEYQFDAQGNLGARVTAVLSGSGEAIRYAYDRGRLSSVTYPPILGQTRSPRNVTYAYGAPGAPNNTAGRVWGRTDASGTTRFAYGNLGEVVHTETTLSAGPAGAVVPTGPLVTQFAYDYFGRMQWIEYPDHERANYEYDAGGLVTRVSSASRTYVDRVTYDAFGQRARIR